MPEVKGSANFLTLAYTILLYWLLFDKKLNVLKKNVLNRS